MLLLHFHRSFEMLLYKLRCYLHWYLWDGVTKFVCLSQRCVMVCTLKTSYGICKKCSILLSLFLSLKISTFIIMGGDNAFDSLHVVLSLDHKNLVFSTKGSLAVWMRFVVTMGLWFWLLHGDFYKTMLNNSPIESDLFHLPTCTSRAISMWWLCHEVSYFAA